MKKQQIDAQWILHSTMDPDYIVDILGVTSSELLDAFPTKFVAFLEEEFEDDDEQDDEEESIYGRDSEEESPPFD